MSIHLTELAAERSTYIVTVAFKDEDGAAVVPSTATWTLTDTAGAVVNSRSAVSLAPVSATEEIVLTGADLALTGSVPEERVVTVKSTYTSSLGVGLTFNEEIRFLLVPLTMVS